MCPRGIGRTQPSVMDCEVCPVLLSQLGQEDADAPIRSRYESVAAPGAKRGRPKKQDEKERINWPKYLQEH